MVQLLHLCMITGETIALTIQTFVSKEMSLPFFFFKILFIFFWLLWVFVAAGRLSLIVVSGGYSCCSAWASLVAEHGQCRGLAGSVVVAHRLSCPAACEVFLQQGLNPCPLHWQVAFLTTGPQGSPVFAF